MTTWNPRANELFLKALELPSPDERQEYLARTCAEDAALRAEVDALLEASARAGRFLESPAVASVATVEEEPVREGPGAVIGPYKLLEQIGEGGFGVVFMAEQTQPVRRKVALKVLKPGMDTRQVVARFEAERQALALMDHPNIARVLDGGSTPAGRPYFVMDLVQGLPITDYCDQAQLAPRQRLELFVHLCQAVQHAHQKGIIHRDLKPSNVLVTLHDGTPLVKVIDFGIAKALGQQLTDKTLFTGFAQMIGTPLYMSPEQAALSNVDVDTRSDIYSLGMLLYELLTGTTPFTKERLQQAGYDELRRIIREEEPPRPSTRISTLGQAAATVSAQRRSDPRRLSQLCRGELDGIVMKALEKDRNRRYETANGFAQDVQRYLADEPVQACPPSAWYRFRKFARRNKTALAVAGLVLLFIALLGGGGGWVIRERAAREEAVAKERLEREQRLTAQVELILDDVDRLEREQKWPEALAAAKRAEAVLAGGEADDSTRQHVTDVVRDLAFVARLDRIRQDRASIVDGKFNNAGAARDYAVAFGEYGVDVASLPAAEAVARLRGKAALAAPVAAALDDWVEARRASGEGDQGWKPLVAVARGLDPDPLRDRLRAAWGQEVTPGVQADLRQLAESIDVKSQSPATLIALVRSLVQARLADSALRILQEGQYAYPADFWLNLELGYGFYYRKDYLSARLYSAVAVSLRPESTAAHTNLGIALCDLGKLDEAVAEYRTAIGLDPKYATAHYDLGNALYDQRKLDEAVAEYRTAIGLNPKHFGAHSNLGHALREQGKLDEAVAEYRTAIGLDPQNADAHDTLGAALKQQGKLIEAVAECRQAIALSPQNARAHANLGAALCDQGKLSEGADECRQAIALNPKHAGAHSTLGAALCAQGKLDEAAAECRLAVKLEPKGALHHSNLGVVLTKQGKLDEAAAECRLAIQLDPMGAAPHFNLGCALMRQGKMDEAIIEYRKAIAINSDLAEVHDNLGIALRKQGKLDEAVAECRKAIAIKPDNAEFHCNLGAALTYNGEFREALTELRRGHELGSKRPGWLYPSAQWVRQVERLVELDGKLPGFLDRTVTPASPAERIELAGLCVLKRLHGAAARFYEEAFAAAPTLADDLAAAHRYNAACAAALAGCGQGKDADKLEDEERARLRRQALDWLRADVGAMGRLLDKGADPARTAATVGGLLTHWQADPVLAGVRGPEALARLPEAERQPWHKLWDDVGDMLKRAQGKTASKKK
jgi:serine/threonine protein kinase/Flp pilus assembly protein TadD